MKYRLKHLLEYVLLRAHAAVLMRLPYRAALALGWVLARIGYHLVRYRVAEARRRIREVLPRLSRREVNRIAWLSFRNLIFMVVEDIRLPRITDRWIEAVVECDQAMARGREVSRRHHGAILALPHMGNWDLAAAVSEKRDLPMLVIARSQKNPLVNAYLNRRRSWMGSGVIDRDDPALLKKILKGLKGGKVLSILIDLRASSGGLEVNYLGHPARIAAGMALLARQAGVPILPVVLIRRGWARHYWTVYDPILPDPSLDKREDWRRMTQQVLDIFTGAVKEHPDQYFWYNKRWVLEGPDDQKDDRSHFREAEPQN